jgi:hypothetical protein
MVPWTRSTTHLDLYLKAITSAIWAGFISSVLSLKQILLIDFEKNET